MRSSHMLSAVFFSAVLCVGCTSQPVVQRIETTSPSTGRLANPAHGKETGVRIGALSGTGGTMANGVATVHSMEDGVLIIGVQLNIAPAKEGFHYVAWIAEGEKSPGVMLGTLTATSPEVRHSLRIETKAPIQAYSLVTITLEGGGIPPGSQVVARGKVKEIAR